ncbi:MAG: TauD/TfdA family dioxygenase, partial [Alphaproteobacteria bacterium]|nr:TauD/TfdA family dioxygenase [Alphaproteobacteria bacterium]
MRLQPTGMFDNAAKDYKHIAVTPLAAAMGAKISGVDLSGLSDGVFAEIEDALYRHKMIYFRDQQIDYADQEAFTLRFGEFGTDAYTTGTEGHPNVQPVIKEAETKVKMIFGEGWHTDSPFLARPPSISMLFGADVPPYGGDTIWANTELAYEHLSDVMKNMLAPLKVHMSAISVMSTIDEMNRANDASGANGDTPDT